MQTARILPGQTNLCPPAFALVLVASCFASPKSTVAESARVSFRRDVMAVLSKTGCNLGTCHGNANGKGGFKLSLRGQSPEEDYIALTRSLNARRTNPLDPESSLILRKPTMLVPHQGGRRFHKTDVEYNLLLQWISQGLPNDSSDLPPVTSLKVTPESQLLFSPAKGFPINVTATFADGTTRDVSRLAVYEPSMPIVTVTPGGLPEFQDHGETTILVRYLNQQQAVRVACWPARPDYTWTGPASDHPVDQAVFKKLKDYRLNPAPICKDTTYIRRVYFDLLGIPPTAEEAREFLNSNKPDKRQQLVDTLLNRSEFPDHQALKWADLLRVEEKTLDRKGTQVFHAWIRNSIANDQPLNEFARELIAARGSTYKNPPANFWRALRDPLSRAESTAQVFLGVRLQCARCHNHPFDHWTQNDYYGWANLFARLDYKIIENRRGDKNDKHEFAGEQIVIVKDKGDVKHPLTGQPQPPQLLGDTNHSLDPEQDRLLQLADWLAAPGQRRFAAAQANRLWFQLFGRGVIDPIDDVRATNPPINAELLNVLTDEFIKCNYSVKHMLGWMTSSQVYQLAALPDDAEAGACIQANFGSATVRRLPAEQLLDALAMATGAPLEFTGYPAGTRAGQIVGVRAVRQRDKPPSRGDRFLTLFGKPPRLQTCECERINEPTLAQMFQLVSGRLVDELLTHKDSNTARLANDNRAGTEIIEELYWTTLSRAPTPAELSACVSRLKTGNRREALEDILWALVNSNEFLLRH